MSNIPTDQNTAESPELQPFGSGPRFSVLMAAYNRATLIGQAIDSVLAQDFSDFELVIVDDGSTDDTPRVVRSYSDSRIRYIQKPKNEGRSATRNRAVREARGEFVLWMADDDLLMPGLLTRYHQKLTAHPHIDVIYGCLQVFDHDTGEDLNIFTPNDWTGRDDEVVGGKLYGSCIPDGGTATRRTLYAQVGPGPYDLEFTRAQDYELWTRLVGQARFMMVDEVVYRYRKHSGGASWGPLIDLSYDSKIIRRHLARHPLDALFTKFEWQNKMGARAVALYRIARNLSEFCDHYNRCRYLAAIQDGIGDPQVIEPLVDGYLRQGRLSEATKVIDAAESFSPLPLAKLQTLKNQIRTIAAYASDMEKRLELSDYESILKGTENRTRAQDSHYFFERARAIALEATGEFEEALRTYCLAARLNPESEECAQRARELRSKLKDASPHTDVDAMISRIRESYFELGSTDHATPVNDALVSVIMSVKPGDDTQSAIESVKAQSYSNWELIVVGQHRSDAHPKVKVVSTQTTSEAHRYNQALVASNGVYLTWLEPECAYSPNHISSLVQQLEDGSTIVRADCHWYRASTTHPKVLVDETIWSEPDIFRRGRELAASQTPLTALGMRRDNLLEQAPFSGAENSPWRFVLAVTRNHAVQSTGLRTYLRPLEPEVPRSEGQGTSLMSFYAEHVDETRFNTQTRKLQNQLLAPFGMALPTHGVTLVAVLAPTDGIDAVRACLTQLEANTYGPFELMVFTTQANDISALKAEFKRLKIKTNPPQVRYEKYVNQALAACNGDSVVVMDPKSRCPKGWLSRFTWWQQKEENVGILVASEHLESQENQIRPAQIVHGHCVWITRRCLDTVGGIDLTLDAPGLEWLDLAIRAKLAGLEVLTVPDVYIEYSTPSPIHQKAKTRLGNRWPFWSHGGLDVPANYQFDATIHHSPVGAAEGFRPDVPPVEIVDAAPVNLLVPAPWNVDDMMVAVLELVKILPPEFAAWFWAEPGSGEQAVERLMAIASERELSLDELPDIRVVDPDLAPDRQGGLLVAADAVYIQEDWPGAPALIRDAVNCGRSVIRSPEKLQRWIEGMSTAQ